MKKITYLILSALLLSISCTAESKKVSNVPKVVPYDLKGMKIVYYSNDSIKENFLFYKQQDAIVTKKQQNFQAELQRRSNEFQEYVQRNSEKEKSGLLSNSAKSAANGTSYLAISAGARRKNRGGDNEEVRGNQQKNRSVRQKIL